MAYQSHYYLHISSHKTDDKRVLQPKMLQVNVLYRIMRPTYQTVAPLLSCLSLCPVP